ncbi:MAG: SH3 domain-containing protein [Chloroflexota bacterium]
MRRTYRLICILFTASVLLLLPLHALMQDLCPALVTQALTEVGDNCSDLSKNSACYGFNRVEATFSQTVANDFFSKPADVADIISLDSISTVPLDPKTNLWGVAVMSIQANIPNSLPGQSVRFIMLGDVSIDNAVPADQALQATEPVKVVTLVNANVRTRASKNANVITSVPAGTELSADGMSQDGEWLRVIVNDSSLGWLSRDLVDSSADLSALPNITADSQSPMQAFYFRTGIGQPSCTEAPTALVVQGPDAIKVNITANGVGIEIGSTITLRTIDENTIQLITIHGRVKTGNLTIPEGFTATAKLDSDGNAGPFGGLRPLTQDELDQLKWLEAIPADVLNYPIKLPDRPRPLPTANPSNTNTSGNQQATSSGALDCSTFRATSPLDGLKFGVNTFYWDPAPGATSYRLNVPAVGSIEVPASTTSVNFDLSPAGENYQLSWSVDALVNGAVACSTALVTVPREAAPNMTASWVCGPSTGQVTINYNNLPPGSTSMVFNFRGDASPGSGYSIASPPMNGSQVFGSAYTLTGGSVAVFPTGRTVSLSPSTLTCSDG